MGSVTVAAASPSARYWSEWARESVKLPLTPSLFAAHSSEAHRMATVWTSAGAPRISSLGAAPNGRRYRSCAPVPRQFFWAVARTVLMASSLRAPPGSAVNGDA